MTWWLVGAAWFVAAAAFGVWAGKRLARSAAQYEPYPETLATPTRDDD